MHRFARLLLISTSFSGLVACATLPGGPKTVPVFFANGATQLGPDALDSISTAAKLAQAFPHSRIQLVGHSLPSNMPSEPLQRSADRAASVRAQLIQDGVAAARISDYAGGALPPVAGTPVGSRRVDITFTH